MIYELPVGTPNNIVGSEEVWANGGSVMVVTIEPDEFGEKYSTSNIEKELLRRAQEAGL